MTSTPTVLPPLCVESEAGKAAQNIGDLVDADHSNSSHDEREPRSGSCKKEKTTENSNVRIDGENPLVSLKEWHEEFFGAGVEEPNLNL